MRRFVLLVLLWVGLLEVGSVESQNTSVTLSLRVGDAVANAAETRELLNQFEAEHPGILVELVSSGNQVIAAPSTLNDLPNYLDAIRDTVTSADVIAVDSNWLLPEATLAGYFLDMEPLLRQDNQLSADLFIPSVLETTQWDNGTWAVPVTYDIITLLYDQPAFDAHNLPYPDENWSVDQLEAAVEHLAEATPALYLNDGNTNGFILAQHFAAAPLLDRSMSPRSPAFEQPSVSTLLASFATLSEAGQIMLPDALGVDTDAPLIVGSVIQTLFDSADRWRIAPLSEATALQFQGFAISAGTAHPLEAYELTAFLSQYPQLITNSGLGAARVDVTPPIPLQAATDLTRDLIPQAQPWTIYHYTHYFGQTIQVINEGTAPPVALQQTQAAILAERDRLMQAADDLTLTVATPPRRGEAIPDGVTLRVAVDMGISPLPTQAAWEEHTATFVDNTPQVAAINLSYPLDGIADLNQSTLDCFYSTTFTPPPEGTSVLRPLNPLLAVDPAYNADDYPEAALQAVTQAGTILALPITIEPYIMWINQDAFAAANVPLPQTGWTTSEFTTAVDQLSRTTSGVVVTVYDTGSTYLFMLIATLDALPLATSQRGESPWLTEPRMMGAIRQVLDMAKTGKLQYLIERESGSGITPIIISPLNTVTVRNGMLVLIADEMGGQSISPLAYQPVPFPSGAYVPMSYAVGAAYITASTPHPELCYAFIRSLADAPALFSAMPASLTRLNDPALAAVRSPDMLNLYREIATLLARDNVVTFSTTPTLENLLVQEWMKDAFDAYVLEDANLEAALASTEETIRLFLDCTPDAPVPDEVASVVACAESVAP